MSDKSPIATTNFQKEGIQMKTKQPKEWHDIRSDFEVMQRMSCVPAHIRKVPSDYIFDENQSVKWNRDKVQENNNFYQAEVARLNTLKNEARDEIHEDIYHAIQCDVGHGLSRKGAMGIWNYAYEEGHACGINDIISNLDSVIDLLTAVLSEVKCNDKR